jgi:hypothetical protein
VPQYDMMPVFENELLLHLVHINIKATICASYHDHRAHVHHSVFMKLLGKI